MAWFKTIVLSVFITLVHGGGVHDIPPGLKFGAATAAYQTEGAWNVSDKSESIWDHFVHTRPYVILDGTNGDIACDSYHQWRRDVQVASEMGLQFYRFSISWARLVPNGFTNYISKDGTKYYNNLINALIEKGIEPVITLYHWDMPQSLQDLGGWTNPLIVDWFGSFARVVYSLFGDRIKTWITVNEPMTFCEAGYGLGINAPGISSPNIGNLICTKNILLAHATAWRIYDEEFRSQYQGKVSLSNQVIWMEALDDSQEEAAILARELMIGLYSHPIYSKGGGWPPVIEKIIAENSRAEGYQQSRLPPFTEAEKEFVKGTYDFYALNFYTSRTVRFAHKGEEVGPWPLIGSTEINVVLSVRQNWTTGGINWLYINPVGLRNQLSWLKQHYGAIDMFIAETGYSGFGRYLNDLDRIGFYRNYLEQVIISIKEDGVNVTGFTSWSMMDLFEWIDGFRHRFGLYDVDFEDPRRTRTPRASAHYYANIIKNRSLDVGY